MGYLTLLDTFLTPISKRLAQIVNKLFLAKIVCCHGQSPRVLESGYKTAYSFQYVS